MYSFRRLRWPPLRTRGGRERGGAATAASHRKIVRWDTPGVCHTAALGGHIVCIASMACAMRRVLQPAQRRRVRMRLTSGVDVASRLELVGPVRRVAFRWARGLIEGLTTVLLIHGVCAWRESDVLFRFSEQREAHEVNLQAECVHTDFTLVSVLLAYTLSRNSYVALLTHMFARASQH